MAAACCSIPSITEIIGMFSLGNYELRLYRTCKAIHVAHTARREWWQHLDLSGSLAWHLDPAKAERAWDSFFAWQRYVHGIPLPVAVLNVRPNSDDENVGGNAIADHCRSEQDEYSPYSYSSCPESSPPESYESDSSEGFDFSVLEWATGQPRICHRCWELPYNHYNITNDELYCHRCWAEERNQDFAICWGQLFRNHDVLGNTVLAGVIVKTLFGDGLDWYCKCGQCYTNWFPLGWMCPAHQPRQVLQVTRAPNHA